MLRGLREVKKLQKNANRQSQAVFKHLAKVAVSSIDRRCAKWHQTFLLASHSKGAKNFVQSTYQLVWARRVEGDSLVQTSRHILPHQIVEVVFEIFVPNLKKKL